MNAVTLVTVFLLIMAGLLLLGRAIERRLLRERWRAEFNEWAERMTESMVVFQDATSEVWVVFDDVVTAFADFARALSRDVDE